MLVLPLHQHPSVGLGVFIVFCVLKLVISLLSLSGLELTAILLPQLPKGGLGWQVCAVHAPSSPTVALFLPVIGPLGKEPGCPRWETEPVDFRWAVGGAGPKSFRFLHLFHVSLWFVNP